MRCACHLPQAAPPQAARAEARPAQPGSSAQPATDEAAALRRQLQAEQAARRRDQAESEQVVASALQATQDASDERDRAQQQARQLQVPHLEVLAAQENGGGPRLALMPVAVGGMQRAASGDQSLLVVPLDGAATEELLAVDPKMWKDVSRYFEANGKSLPRGFDSLQVGDELAVKVGLGLAGAVRVRARRWAEGLRGRGGKGRCEALASSLVVVCDHMPFLITFVSKRSRIPSILHSFQNVLEYLNMRIPNPCTFSRHM